MCTAKLPIFLPVLCSLTYFLNVDRGQLQSAAYLNLIAQLNLPVQINTCTDPRMKGAEGCLSFQTME